MVGCKPVEELIHILIVRIWFADRFAVGSKTYIIRLCIGSELAALQITPAVANRFQFALFTILSNNNRLVKSRLVIYIKRDDDIVLQGILHTLVGKHFSLHFTAVDAAIAREIEEHTLVLFFC